jgi:hypothetical protein
MYSSTTPNAVACEVSEAAPTTNPQAEREAFWSDLEKKRPPKDRDATALREGRSDVAMRILKNRERSACETSDAWRYFDALATTLHSKDEAGRFVVWAEWALPGLIEWGDLGDAAYEALEQRAKAFQGKRLTNAEFGQLLGLTRAEREAYRIIRRFVTESDLVPLTPQEKRLKTLKQKDARRDKAEGERRKAGIKPRKVAAWRWNNWSSRAAFYRHKRRKMPMLPTLEEIAPWKRENMPRRTWFWRAKKCPGWREASIWLSLPPKLRKAYLNREIARSRTTNVALNRDDNVTASSLEICTDCTKSETAV